MNAGRLKNRPALSGNYSSFRLGGDRVRLAHLPSEGQDGANGVSRVGPSQGKRAHWWEMSMENVNAIRPYTPSNLGGAKAVDARSSTPKVGGNLDKSTAPVRQTQPAVSKAEVQAAVSSLNIELESYHSLRFEVDDSTDLLIVSVIDQEGNVVRQIPPEVSVRLAASKELSGLFTNVQG